MQQMRTSIVIGAALILFASGAGADGTIELKADDATMLARGKIVYQRECAACHGVNLEGQDGWRDKTVYRMRLAPPHDKSGHTWHHPDALLFQLTKYGLSAIIGRDYPNAMPVYDSVLSDLDIIAALSYIKSTWPQDVKDIHAKINADYKLNLQMEKRGKGTN